MKGRAPPPATVVVTSPTELVGADDTVPATELVVASREVVVTFDVLVVGLTVLLVVGLTVLLVVGATVLLVVGLTVLLVVGATVLLVVGATVLLVVGATVLLVVGLTVDVVVPPVGVADASCPTLTPATTSVAMITSQPAVRLRTFFTCLAIDLYLSRQRPTDRGPATAANKTTSCFRLWAYGGGTAQAMAAADGD